MDAVFFDVVMMDELEKFQIKHVFLYEYLPKQSQYKFVFFAHIIFFFILFWLHSMKNEIKNRISFSVK